MKIFYPKEDFTHYGRFYFVPIYLNLADENEPIVSGRNLIYDKLFMFMIWFHNFFIERFSQMFAAIFDYEYEPGFMFDDIKEIELLG